MGEFVVGVCAMTAFVFGASAMGKLHSRAAYRAYRAGLAANRLVPAPLLATVAAVLAVCEAVCALWLAGCAAALAAVAGHTAVLLAESSLAVAALLTATLTVGLWTAIRRGSAAPCPCFSVTSSRLARAASRPVGPAHLLRNLVLLTAVASGLALGPSAGRPPAPAGLALALVAAVVAALLIIRWEDLAEVFTPVQAHRRPRATGKARAGSR
jgi:hypothetical protein